MDCLFCKFISGELQTQKVFENDDVLGFKDIYPQAAEHYLFVSKKHTTNIIEMVENNSEEIVAVYQAISEFCHGNDLSKNGFRVVTNTGSDGGQTVFHTHFHVLGGEPLKGFGSN
ncbi:MAG: HIT domain-containing protein [Halobacteriovoraceae bacterium]|nr:HIT domain-containing protein [Halobacteriovoraceae bacterium]